MATNYYKSGGGYATDTQSEVITLQATSRANNCFSSFTKGGQTTGFQIPVGKTLIITGYRVHTGEADNAQKVISLGYSDADVAQDQTFATGRTNPVPVLGDPEYNTDGSLSGGIIFNPALSGDVLQGISADGMNLDAAPAGKYMHARFAYVGGFGKPSTILIFGYLK